MKVSPPKLVAGALLAACIVSSVGCYPAYPPGAYGSAYNQDAKGSAVPSGPVGPPPPPGYVGVDPALVVAGVAAAGILGYAIGNNHHSYCGPVYYGRGYGYGGPRYYYR